MLNGGMLNLARITACISLLAALGLAGTASAATVRMDRLEERDEGETYYYGQVALDAGSGEVNKLSVEYIPPPEGGTPAVLVTDPGAPLTAQSRCQQVDANTVRCQAADVPAIYTLEANLGDMDDKAAYVTDDRSLYVRVHGGEGEDELTSFWGLLQGGPGNDTLVGRGGDESLEGEAGDDLIEGNAGSDYLDGGTGDDVMRGGDERDYLYAGGSAGEPGAAGEDTLEGGPGDDTLSDEDGNGTTKEIGPDVLDGGEGNDDLGSYILRDQHVSVDLTATGGQGQVGEDDTLEGFESVTGGAGDDLLIGNEAPNYIDGAGGQDTMVGAGGDDRLISNVNPAHMRRNALARQYGPDYIDGGAGGDLVETYATMESEIACGGGDDSIVLEGYASDNDHPHSSLGPLLSPACEGLEMRGSRPRNTVVIDPSPIKVTRKRLVFSFFDVECCMHFFEIEHVRGQRTELAHKRVRRNRISLNVGRKVIRRSREKTVTLRGKVTHVSINRFVWRFQFGP